MSTLSLETAVGQLVAERPARSRVLEELGIDYCCGGRRPLAQACEAIGLDPAVALSKLAEADAVPSPMERDWTMASLTELADHIEETHHAYVRSALPRLVVLIDKVNRAHGVDDVRLSDLRVVFTQFRADFESHMLKEEQILFPLCRKIDQRTTDQPPGDPRSQLRSVTGPISIMMAEHDHAGGDLATMRTLTDEFTPPPGACNTYRAMLQALQELEDDTHQHVHLENNILFVKALANGR